MNTSKIYSQAIGRVPKEEQQIEKEDAASAQAKFDWLQSTITQQMFKELSDEVQLLLNQAVDMSVSYHEKKNHEQIINTLVRVATLRKVITNYATKS